MANAGYLVPPPVTSSATEGSGGDATASGAAPEETRTPLQKRLWEVTWIRMERFLPGLLEGVFPGARREMSAPSTIEAGSRAGPTGPSGAATAKEGAGEEARETTARQSRDFEGVTEKIRDLKIEADAEEGRLQGAG